MLQIEVKVTGTADVISKLRNLDTSLLNFRSEMDDIGEELSSYFGGQVFASQGAIIGVRWPTLAAKTVAYKKKHYPEYATTPLVRTGEMKDNWYHKATTNSVTIGNQSPQFKYHQSSAARTKIPYRPMMAVNDDAESIVSKIINAGIERRIASA